MHNETAEEVAYARGKASAVTCDCNNWLDKQIIIHAIKGGKCPYDDRGLEQMGFIKFNGNQHDCYNYIWVEEQLKRLNFAQLRSLYHKVNT